VLVSAKRKREITLIEEKETNSNLNQILAT
jgi:hypothetical protein